MNARAFRSVALLAAFVAVAAPATLLAPHDVVAAEPPPANPMHFTFEVDGVASMTFSEVTGANIENDIVVFKSGQKPLPPPPEQKMVSLMLKAPVNTSDMRVIQNWIASNKERPLKRNATLIAVDMSGKPMLRYVLIGVVPTKLETSSLNAGQNQAAIMTLVVKAESFKRVS